MIQKICGFEDDGLPLAADGVHPDYLKGYTIDRYLAILDKGRRLIHRAMKQWKDKDLEKYFIAGKIQLSRTWTLYHVLEHFSNHFGQILLIKHLMRDAGVLVPSGPHN